VHVHHLRGNSGHVRLIQDHAIAFMLNTRTNLESRRSSRSRHEGVIDRHKLISNPGCRVKQDSNPFKRQICMDIDNIVLWTSHIKTLLTACQASSGIQSATTKDVRLLESSTCMDDRILLQLDLGKSAPNALRLRQFGYMLHC
jgi:hypothetical protein